MVSARSARGVFSLESLKPYEHLVQSCEFVTIFFLVGDLPNIVKATENFSIKLLEVDRVYGVNYRPRCTLISTDQKIRPVDL